jgi:hypothetical protein
MVTDDLNSLCFIGLLVSVSFVLGIAFRWAWSEWRVRVNYQRVRRLARKTITNPRPPAAWLLDEREDIK